METFNEPERKVLDLLADGRKWSPIELGRALGTHPNGPGRTASGLARRGLLKRIRNIGLVYYQKVK